MQQSAFDSMHNLRDLAGTPVARGGTAAQLRPGLLLRSATPADAEQKDVDQLLSALPSLSVLDLRSEPDALCDDGPRLLADRTRHVEMLPKVTGQKRLTRHVLTDRLHVTLPLLPARICRALPIPFVQGWGQRKTDKGVRKFLETIDLADVYWWILSERKEALKQVLSEVSEAGRSGQATLVHCAHGKDRTGVVIAVLLHICGADVQTIANDYACSDEWGCSPKGQDIMLNAMPERYRERISEWNTPGEDEVPADEEPPRFWWSQFGRWCGADAKTMVEVFARVERKYGSMDAYLDSIGFDAAQRAELQEAFTCEA